MNNLLFKILSRSFAFAFILTASNFSYGGDYDDSCYYDNYQWTQHGSFKKNDLVRYKGLAYKQKVALTSGVRPDLNPDKWTFLGACWINQKVTCDFNGDGKMDLAKGFSEVALTGAIVSDKPPYRENAHLTSAGEVTITYGNTSPTAPADQIWTQNGLGMHAYARKTARFGSGLSAGDFNGDNFCDLAIGAPGFSYDTASHKGLVNVLYGSPNGLAIYRLSENGRPLNPYDAQRLDQGHPDIPGGADSGNPSDDAESGDRFGESIAAGDFNGDGYADLAIGSPGEDAKLIPQLNPVSSAGYFHILYGSKTGIQTANPKPAAYFQHIRGTPLYDVEEGDQYGLEIVAADFDMDGYSDVVVAAPAEDKWTGRISVFRGSSKGIDTYSRVDIDDNSIKAGTAKEENKFGNSMWITDFNRDGFPDLEIVINNRNTNEGIQYFIPGSTSGLIPKNAKVIRFDLGG